jgi:hypothetical protein
VTWMQWTRRFDLNLTYGTGVGNVGVRVRVRVVKLETEKDMSKGSKLCSSSV